MKELLEAQQQRDREGAEGATPAGSGGQSTGSADESPAPAPALEGRRQPQQGNGSPEDTTSEPSDRSGFSKIKRLSSLRVPSRKAITSKAIPRVRDARTRLGNEIKRAGPLLYSKVIRSQPPKSLPGFRGPVIL